MTKKDVSLEQLENEKQNALANLAKAVRDEKMLASFYYEGKLNKILKQIKKAKNG
jgi:histidyl-tRNA synthetase